jgi:hypothetical protein
MEILLGVGFIVLGTVMIEKIAERSICRSMWLEEYRNKRRYEDAYRERYGAKSR